MLSIYQIIFFQKIRFYQRQLRLQLFTAITISLSRRNWNELELFVSQFTSIHVWQKQLKIIIIVVNVIILVQSVHRLIICVLKKRVKDHIKNFELIHYIFTYIVRKQKVYKYNKILISFNQRKSPWLWVVT